MPNNKPIIATTLSGLFMTPDAWKNAHVLWFEEAAALLNDPSVRELANEENYFEYVDNIMQRLYPEMSEEERTRVARKEYFTNVVKYIQINLDECVRNDVVEYFMSIKDRFRICLITTNTREALTEILSTAELNDLFDIIEYSEPEEKDNKDLVFKRFIELNGKPIIYIGGDRKASYDFCKTHNIKCVFANIGEEKEDDIPDIENVNSLDDLKDIIENLS